MLKNMFCVLWLYNFKGLDEISSWSSGAASICLPLFLLSRDSPPLTDTQGVRPLCPEALPWRPVSTGEIWAVGTRCALLRNPVLSGGCLPGYLVDGLIAGELLYSSGHCGELIATQNNSCLQTCKSCPGHRASIHFSPPVKEAGFASICTFISIFLVHTWL